MQKHISFIFLTLIIAALAGTASAVLVSNSLERYAASLLDDRRFAALAPLQHTLSPTTLEESLVAIQETMLNSVVVIIDEDGGRATKSSFSSEEKLVHGEGIIVSADGWIVTTHAQLARYVNGKGEYAGFSIVRGGEIFVVEKIVKDTQTDAVAIRVKGAQGWTPVELAESDEVFPGGTIFGIGSLGEVRVTSLVVRGIQDEDSIVPAEEPSAVWSISESLPAGTPLLTGQTRLFGFVDDEGYAVPAQAIRSFIKQALRGSVIAHAALGVSIAELSHLSSLSNVVTQGYSEGALVIAPAGERTATVQNGPADSAGLTDGDIILALDDIRITKKTTCADILATYAPGQQVALRVARNGEVRDVQVTLGVWEELIY
jgi:S1-C subfamily serine protease